MDGVGILFLILTLLLIGLLVFIKFSKTGQSFVCPKCPTCPSGQRIGIKYNSTDDKIVNGLITNINTTFDSLQKKYATCDSLAPYFKDDSIPAAGTKCEDYRKKVEAAAIPTGQDDIDKSQKSFVDSFMKDVCLPDGTVDHDKLAASSKILQKTFCV